MSFVHSVFVQGTATDQSPARGWVQVDGEERFLQDRGSDSDTSSVTYEVPPVDGSKDSWRGGCKLRLLWGNNQNDVTDVIWPRSEHGPFRGSSKAFAASSDGSLYAIGYDDGSVSLHEPRTGSTLSLVPDVHALEVTVLKFFPSNQVLLTGGLDSTLKIIRCSDGWIGARLQGGHKRGIEDAAFLGTGRNLVSCSADGSLLLWETGSASLVTKFGRGGSSSVPLRCVCTAKCASKSAVPTSSADGALHFFTSGQCILAGGDKGIIELFDARVGSFIASMKFQSRDSIGDPLPSVRCLQSTGDYTFRAGYESGSIVDADVRMPNDAVKPSFRVDGKLSCLADTWIGTTGGYVAQLPEAPQPSGVHDAWPSAILCGLDFYAISQIVPVHSTDTLLLFSADSTVRTYPLS